MILATFPAPGISPSSSYGWCVLPRFLCNVSGSKLSQVYAIASLTLGPAHYDTAESYYHMALAHQPSVLELDSIESIQSLLCCAVYSVRSPAGVSLWYVEDITVRAGVEAFSEGSRTNETRKISGLAIRYCIELGYHRSAATYRKNSNPLIAEMSKRCFWVAYDIDRVAAFILGRPVGIPDDCIDAEVSLFPKPKSFGH